MTETAQALDALRDTIIADPELILEDRDIMHALISANEKSLGGNIVDLRGMAMERLESRLDRLEDTHRSVIAAAYENLAGTNQVHRAILSMLDPTEFEAFLTNLGDEVGHILRVDCVKLVLESVSEGGEPALSRLGGVLRVVEPGFLQDYLGQSGNHPHRSVMLRQVKPGPDGIYGSEGAYVNSEACLRLDFGEGRLPGMLALGAEDPHQFKPNQGTDLLAFFAGVFERQMRRWLG